MKKNVSIGNLSHMPPKSAICEEVYRRVSMPTSTNNAPVERPWLTMCNRLPEMPNELNETIARAQKPKWETELYATRRRTSVCM